jgi:dynein heavy chain
MQSSITLKRSQSEHVFAMGSTFQAVQDTGYFTPSDRIGRSYTPTARSLTMAKATAVSKKMLTAPPAKKVASGMPVPTVTATIGRSKQTLMMSQTAPGLQNKEVFRSNVGERSTRRLARSPGNVKYVASAHVSEKTIQGLKGKGKFDFSGWNPEPEEPEKKREESGAPAVPALALTPEQQAAAQQSSVENYWNAVQVRVQTGVLNASGTSTPLATLRKEWVDQVIQRISLPTRKSQSQNLIPQSTMDQAVMDMLNEMNDDYFKSVAQGVINYELESPRGAAALQLNKAHLSAEARWWTSDEYTVNEWRIMRETGIPHENVMSANQLMERQLCVTQASLTELQHLWMGGQLPADWNQSAGSGDAATAGDLKLDTYSSLLLTDVGTSGFRSSLPLMVENYTQHIERHCSMVREGLSEFWITAASEILSSHLRNLRASLPNGEAEEEQLETEEDQPEQRPLDYSQWFEESTPNQDGDGPDEDSQAAGVLNTRMEQEGLMLGGDADGDDKMAVMFTSNQDKDRVVGVLDAAAVLMCRQLRSTTEASVRTMVEFFERFDQKHASGDSAFVITLKLVESAPEDINSDEDACAQIRLDPSPEELQLAFANSINAVVKAAQQFPRVDPHITPPLEKPSSAHIGPCALTEEDELVLEAKKRVAAAVERHLIPPIALLENFKQFAPLLKGEEEKKVKQAVENRSELGNTRAVVAFLTKEINRLRTLSDDISNAVPNFSYHPIFAVRCHELKEMLVKKVDDLINLIIETMVEDNGGQMGDMVSEYETIGNKLVAEPVDSSELKELQEYSTTSVELLNKLQDQLLDDVCQRVSFLLAQQHKSSREEMAMFLLVYNWPDNIKTYQQRSWELQNSRKRELEMVVEGRQQALLRDFSNISKKLEKVNEFGSLIHHEVIHQNKRIHGISQQLNDAENESEEISEQEKLLEMPVTDNSERLSELKTELGPLEKLWTVAGEYLDNSQIWNDDPVATVQAEDAEMKSDGYRRTMMKMCKELEKAGESKVEALRAASQLREELDAFVKEQIPLMLLLCTPGLRERHWQEMEKITGVEIGFHDGSNMAQMMEVGLHHHVNAIEETCVSATKEYSLEKAMDKMESEWAGMNFGTKEYRTSGTSILSSVDEIQQILDDQIVKTQAMAGSRYIKPYLKRMKAWETTLINMQEIVDQTLKVQATWLYLEPIFSSEDIMRQMPKEGELFKEVDKLWRDNMATTIAEPECLKVARRDGIIAEMQKANELLETIQKGLNDYLETKRLFFARFFFLSNDELLEILSETKDPLRVQPHCKKCFDGIAELRFEENLDITAMISAEGEEVKFEFEKTGFEPINPNKTGGNVEVWLLQIEQIMRRSIAQVSDDAMEDFQVRPRLEFSVKWCGMAVLCINQLMWVQAVEKSLPEGSTVALGEHLHTELLATVEMVRGKLSKLSRKTLGAMVTMDVHNRDTTQMVGKSDCHKATDFDWTSQLRYYWEPGGVSAHTGVPESIKCQMINAEQKFAYEYLGNSSRLVITPLTDRCYRTLMGALHLGLGGAPEGPAGTGKTETTKDLGKAIAIQCVVFNCSDGLDYIAMGKFFKGLASAGAWACFDEFNRIQLEVLSVVAQQVLCIQLAKAAKKKIFLFEGTMLPLNPTCCPFITMNPGYAGRAELPDNLKVLFRTVAMMVPDYGMIAEILLYSFGYTSGKAMANKIVYTYKLCSEQLSSQSHYDYGMRAVISVLMASGNLKREEGHLPEDVLVLRSIIGVNLPKFLAPDVPLFAGITSDLFPGVKIEPPDRKDFLTAVDEACQHYRLQNTPTFIDKIIQAYEMMVVRHSYMYVGKPFAGKTMCWKVLQRALSQLHITFPEDARWCKVHTVVQNPKSITMGELYGQFDPVSHEWSDGVLAINYRNCAACKTVGAYPLINPIPKDRKWCIFDGPVDAIWIENMNTVMDDNKKLCLMSGEIIAMSATMSINMETMDLAVASPATVSRNGIIYMEPEHVIGWRPLRDSWLDKLMMDEEQDPESHKKDAEKVEHPFQITQEQRDTIVFLFEWLVEPCLAFLRKEQSEMSPTDDANLVQSLINLMESCLEEIYVDADQHAQKELRKGTGASKGKKGKKKDEVKNHDEVIESSFIFSLIWSTGVTVGLEGQEKFSTYFRGILEDMECIENEHIQTHRALMVRKWKIPEFPDGKKTFDLSLPLPKQGSVYNYCYSSTDSKWKKWEDTIDEVPIPDDARYADITVQTVYTAQFDYMLDLLLTHQKKVLVCGPTGTGKSLYAMSVLQEKLPQDKYNAIFVTFSAKTTASMTQDIIDGKLDKRRKGVYGPPPNQYNIVFVDDLNMPEVETYGAQPPIELLRQFCDANATPGGWYDMHEMVWKTIVDTNLLCAMGPPGGGRNHLTPRFVRHLNLLCFVDFDDVTLDRIFTTISNWSMKVCKYSADVAKLTTGIVKGTLDTYRAAMKELLPTPSKSHYTFNLRDFSRVMAGIAMSKPTAGFTPDTMVRLWCHENLRVFSDRLTDDHDRQWMLKHLKLMTAKHFGKKFDTIFETITKDEETSLDDMRSCFFGKYMNPDLSDDARIYEEVSDTTTLTTIMEDYLKEFNAMSRKPMNLVLFLFAVEHVSRIARVLDMPGGNALLVGVGGSGRQSCGRLAAAICDFEVFQIEISKQYGKVEWREDLKTLLIGAGTGAREMVFLFSDTQIKEEAFVEDINNVLNAGEVPNLFPYDERVALTEAVRPHARAVFGKRAGDMGIPELYSFFVNRVRQRLHTILAFSPIGDAFRARLRLFPALVNCCTIDWFTAWPQDALFAVATKFVADVKLDSEEVRSAIVDNCQYFQKSASDLSAKFLDKQRRVNYITPTSYLELIVAFKTSLATKREEVLGAKNRYEKGLEQLSFAETNVATMQQELEDLQPVLKQSQKDTDALMVKIQAQLPGVEKKRGEVGIEAAAAQKEADGCNAEKEGVEADLAEAIPALNAAVKALDTLKPSDIDEVKKLSKPPAGVRLVCEAVCIMLSVKPQRIPDPEDPSRRIMDFWGPSQKMLSDANFLPTLKGYDKDNIDVKIIAKLRDNYQTNPDFTIEKAAKASKACAGLCAWCKAMDTYDRVAKVVAPKREALKRAEAQLEVTMGQLASKQAELKEVEDGLAKLQGDFEGANQKKADLLFQVDLCGKKLIRAESLIGGLGGEKVRWTEYAKELGIKYIKLTGDVLVSAGVVAYLGPFTSDFRAEAMADWVNLCKEKNIPCSDDPSLSGTLGNPVKVREWNIQGLPTDDFSIDNGIVVFNARRWPLMIDPQGQANKWVRNMEGENNLQVIKLTMGDYLRTIENAVQFGYPVLLENVLEEMDPSIEPLLMKQTFKQGGVTCIRLGDSTVEYSEVFRFYITTKLRNPHYLPEVSVKVTLLNFMITPLGLSDQLLGIVVREERPDLEEAKANLIMEGAANKRKLKEIEDEILHILSSSSGNILEDEGAINTLNQSKVVSDDIKVKQAVADKTEADIDEVRKGYKPVAFSTQVLFFCIAEMCNIEPVYQYSLGWFVNLFIMSIRKSEKSSDMTQRMNNLDEHYTLSLYRNVCRSLLEKDKLLFSFLLTIDILKSKNLVDADEWYFLLTGGVAVGDNPNANPAPDWLAEKNWAEFCRLGDLPAFAGIRESFTEFLDDWKRIYDSEAPQDEALPGHFDSALNSFQKMMAVRCIRPDRVCLAVQNFVIEKMGEVFVKPPPFNLGDCYADSTVETPLVFILSPGSDPMGSILKLAGELKVEVEYISLGQGQGPIAEAMLSKAQVSGTWVILQNCHLAPSWMNSMEKIAEELDAEVLNATFRMWCTSYPSDVFPVSVLQNGVKMTQEPPKGLRANLIGSYAADPVGDSDFFDACTKQEPFKKLCFCLCFFHALCQERRQFGPLGWNIPYEFNLSDLEISLRQLVMFLDENDEVPFAALNYCIGECNYGGRVTDDKDRRTLNCILDSCYNEDNLVEDSKLSPSGTYVTPPDGSYDTFTHFIEALPLVAEPEVFGMHENANITKNQKETTNLFVNVLLTQASAGGGGGGGASSKDATMQGVAEDIKGKLPPDFDMEQAAIRYPVRWDESMNTVLTQELLRFNNLMRCIRASLVSVVKAIMGLVVMSADLETLGNALYYGTLPAMWKAKSYPSLKPLAGYSSDLFLRLEFFDSWLQTKPPPVFWLSAYFFTQAFLTGSSQNFARKYTVPIDQVDFDFEMLPRTEYTNKPKDGVYTYGLFLEGAIWDKKNKTLIESLPKQLYSPAPLIWFKPARKDDLDVYEWYSCPVYKTSDRRGILATTGHSSNFIMFINMPSVTPEHHWVLRGAAMLSQLDD